VAECAAGFGGPVAPIGRIERLCFAGKALQIAIRCSRTKLRFYAAERRIGR
jgi:hypothetical protein